MFTSVIISLAFKLIEYVDRQDIGWTSLDGEMKIVSCNPAPRPSSKLWNLLGTWRPATQAELDDFHSKGIPENLRRGGVAVIAGAGIQYPSIAVAERSFVGIDLKSGSSVVRSYPPDPMTTWQLLVKKNAPVLGNLPKGGDVVQVGIFPMPRATEYLPK